jgi:2-polyprenyl-3-methyl-5-hydroxy-6-metoxy-1,4-benzoquinol methylase
LIAEKSEKSEDVNEIRVFYDSWFSRRKKRKPTSEYVVKWAQKRLHMAINSLLKECKGDSVLDFGCGAGRLTQLLMKRFKKVVGVDISHVGLRIARYHSQKVRGDCNLVLGEVFNLPFKRECFDVIVMSEVIEHLEHQMKALNIVNKLLKHDGYFILTTPNRVYSDVTELIYKFARKPFSSAQIIEKQIHPRALRSLVRHFFNIEKEKGVYFTVPCAEKLVPGFLLPFEIWLSETLENCGFSSKMAIYQCLLCSPKNNEAVGTS